MASDEVLIQTAISSWEHVIKRVGTLCLSCSQEQLLVEVAPAKNRISYLFFRQYCTVGRDLLNPSLVLNHLVQYETGLVNCQPRC